MSGVLWQPGARKYNCKRPHSSLDYRTPDEFRKALEGRRAMAPLPSQTTTIVDPSTGESTGADSVASCQFDDSGRNIVRGPHFTNSDIYITKTFPMGAGITSRLDAQMFNAFNHPNFALPSNVEAGVPGQSRLDIPARSGTLDSTVAPPTCLFGVGLGGDSSPRMIAFQGRIDF